MGTPEHLGAVCLPWEVLSGQPPAPPPAQPAVPSQRDFPPPPLRGLGPSPGAPTQLLTWPQDTQPYHGGVWPVLVQRLEAAPATARPDGKSGPELHPPGVVAKPKATLIRSPAPIARSQGPPRGQGRVNRPRQQPEESRRRACSGTTGGPPQAQILETPGERSGRSGETRGNRRDSLTPRVLPTTAQSEQTDSGASWANTMYSGCWILVRNYCPSDHTWKRSLVIKCHLEILSKYLDNTNIY